jgi:hypothetical protein
MSDNNNDVSPQTPPQGVRHTFYPFLRRLAANHSTEQEAFLWLRLREHLQPICTRWQFPCVEFDGLDSGLFQSSCPYFTTISSSLPNNHRLSHTANGA